MAQNSGNWLPLKRMLHPCNPLNQEAAHAADFTLNTFDNTRLRFGYLLSGKGFGLQVDLQGDIDPTRPTIAELHKLNITDPDTLPVVLEGTLFEMIIHGAGEAHIRSVTDPAIVAVGSQIVGAECMTFYDGGSDFTETSVALPLSPEQAAASLERAASIAGRATLPHSIDPAVPATGLDLAMRLDSDAVYDTIVRSRLNLPTPQ